jgi:hypothetical protein
VIGVLNAILPMQEINEYLFPIEESVNNRPFIEIEDSLITVFNETYIFWLGLYNRKSSNIGKSQIGKILKKKRDKKIEEKVKRRIS